MAAVLLVGLDVFDKPVDELMVRIFFWGMWLSFNAVLIPDDGIVIYLDI